MSGRLFKHLRTALCAAFALVGQSTHAAGQSENALTIFAAASTTNVINEIIDLYNARNPRQQERTRASFASSATLAKQITSGAPADIYLSASIQWMDYVEETMGVSEKVDLLGNALVLIAPSDSTFSFSIEPSFTWPKRLKNERLALGDPDYVPAGIYAKQSLQHFLAWKSIAPRLARTKDVRAALALVERGEAALGIVYASDAKISKRVRVIASFPKESHSPIIYPAAVISGRARPSVLRLYRFLNSPEAAAVFLRHGFSLVRKP
jgi:molybdate transport system substrate-binding protein